MAKQRNVFALFDLDSCLIQANGYRSAVKECVNYYLHKAGQTQLSFADCHAERFEWIGVPAEWDMAPLALCTFYEWMADYLPVSFPYLCTENIPLLPALGTQSDFSAYMIAKIDAMAALIQNRAIPPLEVLAHVRQKKGTSIFPLLWDQPILTEILENSLSPQKSVTLNILECYILGSTCYQKTYRLPAPFETDSELLRLDKPNLSADNNRRICALAEKGKIFPSIMTARPNLLPAECIPCVHKYPTHLPEAECGVQLLGWQDHGFPIVGSGSMNYLENKYGFAVNTFLKPHPIHALSAIISCLNGNVLTALELGFALWQGMANPLLPNEDLTIAVFEDSRNGIRSADSATAILHSWGLNVDFQAYGIETTAEKSAALRLAGAEVYADINVAMESFFQNNRL